MHPSDWQTIETATLSGGAYVLSEAGQSTTVNSATRRLWGQPVVVTVGQTPGAVWFVNSGSVTLNTDRGIEVRSSEAVDGDFQCNEVRARREGRFDLSVHKPDGVVKIDLTA